MSQIVQASPLAAAAQTAPRRRGPRFSLPVLVLGAILLVLIAPPTIFLAKVSIYTTNPNGSFGELTLKYYYQLFTGRFFFSSLVNTTIYGIGTAFIAILLGTVQAIIVERTNTPG